MEKDSKTTVAVERTTFAKLDRLAKANSVSKMEYITHAINYFEKYGINPVEHESPAQEMQKLIKRMDQVFAFLKKQETDLVRPACEALAGASTQITISLSSLLSEEKFRRFLKDNKELLAEIITFSSAAFAISSGAGSCFAVCSRTACSSWRIASVPSLLVCMVAFTSFNSPMIFSKGE